MGQGRATLHYIRSLFFCSCEMQEGVKVQFSCSTSRWMHMFAMVPLCLVCLSVLFFPMKNKNGTSTFWAQRAKQHKKGFSFFSTKQRIHVVRPVVILLFLLSSNQRYPPTNHSITNKNETLSKAKDEWRPKEREREGGRVGRILYFAKAILKCPQQRRGDKRPDHLIRGIEWKGLRCFLPSLTLSLHSLSSWFQFRMVLV